MADVMLQAVQACYGMARGDTTVVARTELIDKLLAEGRLVQVDPLTGAPMEPPWACPLCLTERLDVIDAGLWLDLCPNCGTTVAPERGVR